MSGFLQDLRYAFRVLRSNKAPTLAAVLALALGIGANTAIFTLLNALLLRPLPVRNAGDLVRLTWSTERFKDQSGLTTRQYHDLSTKSTTLTDFFGRHITQASLTFDQTSERITAELVTGNYFSTLGVRPAAGRTFTAQEDVTPGAHPFIVLSHTFWKRRFNRDPAVIGRTARINGFPMTIIGVTEPSFQGLDPGQAPEVRVPSTMIAWLRPEWTPASLPSSMWLNAFARLKPGAGEKTAAAEMEVIYRQTLDNELAGAPDSQRRMALSRRIELPSASSGAYGVGRSFARPLWLMFALAGVILLMGCINLANLLLARGAARAREIATRMALGADRLRIAKQLLTESVLLAFTGGLAGLLFALWASDFLFAQVPAGRMTLAADLNPDWRVLTFTALVSMLTTVVFGSLPALRSCQVDLVPTLKGDLTGSRRFVPGSVLVAGQVALTVVMLFGAVLLARTLTSLRNVPTGFQRDRILMLSLNPALSGHKGPALLAFYDELVRRVSALPGVQSAAMERCGLLGTPFGIDRMPTAVEGYEQKGDEVSNPLLAPHRMVSGPNYFRTVGIPLVAGREFTDADSSNAPKVAIVNAKFAKYYFGDGNPIGRTVGWNGKADCRIIGVVGDARHYSLRDESPRTWYVPYAQADTVRWPQMALHVRTAGDESQVASLIRNEIRAIDPGVPVFDVKTVEARVDETLYRERVLAMVAGFFAVLACVLAAVGLYGVIAYIVGLRTQEIGIRIALGATRTNVIRIVIWDSLVVIVCGLLAGSVFAYALSGIAASFVYGVAARDSLSLTVALLVAIAVSALAAWVPARRASRLEPMSALRRE